MQRTFRPGRDILISGICTVAVLTPVLIGTLVGSVFDPEERFVLLSLAAFWTVPSVGAVYAIVSFYRTRLEVDGPRLAQHGVFSTREVLLDGSATLVWRFDQPRGSVTISSPAQRLTILFSSLELKDRIALIERLRNLFPDAKQSGWSLFCLRCVLPSIELVPPPESAQIINPRRAMDRVFLALLIPQLIVTFLAVWLAGPRFWPTIVCVPAMWLLFRLTGPTREIRQLPEIESRGGKWLGLAFMALIVGLALSTLNHWILNVVCSAMFVVGMIQIFRCASNENRQRQGLWKEQAKTADARWTAALAEYKQSAP